MGNRNFNPLNEGYTASSKGHQGTSEAPKKIAINIQSGITQTKQSQKASNSNNSSKNKGEQKDLSNNGN